MIFFFDLDLAGLSELLGGIGHRRGAKTEPFWMGNLEIRNIWRFWEIKF